MSKPENHILVIFGASGDLTRRKLLPALHSLLVHGLLPDKFAVVGASRAAWSDDDFRGHMMEGLREFSHEWDDSGLKDFIGMGRKPFRTCLLRGSRTGFSSHF